MLDIEGFEDDVTEYIGIEPYVSEDATGKQSFGPGVMVEAVVQRVDKFKVLPNGASMFLRALIFIGPSPLVFQRDRVTLGDPYQGLVSGVDKPTDQGVLHHQEISLS